MQTFRIIGLFLTLAIAVAALSVPGASAQQGLTGAASIGTGGAVTLIADTKAKQSKVKAKAAIGKCYHEPICQVCCYDSHDQLKSCKFDTRWCGQ